jgi:hypothetical protein
MRGFKRRAAVVKSYYARNRFKVAEYDKPEFFFGFTSKKKLTSRNRVFEEFSGFRHGEDSHRMPKARLFGETSFMSLTLPKSCTNLPLAESPKKDGREITEHTEITEQTEIQGDFPNLFPSVPLFPYVP